ncbi:uncharacterized protein PITG_19543 [Phytophthora infestans T30-4]|uniref:Uncharacterized protein n=1 Tax=Phytophthora infestans (strain T30-4) TaxID=403677 RepID=D0P0C2_PHYIT|nr:uncharacterized protein PITG_19543 [Phytophthora infestans T30-4]EEY70285.1 hypothetical protein PITG_19543 [Phytophthora infestans T30-4]|eukprot:XP_002996941.1 hypothetical protein PITG_19543 [Phytophthora infestans T30-4]
MPRRCKEVVKKHDNLASVNLLTLQALRGLKALRYRCSTDKLCPSRGRKLGNKRVVEALYK